MLIMSAAHAATVDAAPRPQAAVVNQDLQLRHRAGDQMSEARSEAAHIFNRRRHLARVDRVPRARQRRRGGLHRAAPRRARSHVEARRPDAGSRRARGRAGRIDARSRAAGRSPDDDRPVSCSRRRGEDRHGCLDAAWAGDRARNRTSPVGQLPSIPGSA